MNIGTPARSARNRRYGAEPCAVTGVPRRPPTKGDTRARRTGGVVRRGAALRFVGAGFRDAALFKAGTRRWNRCGPVSDQLSQSERWRTSRGKRRTGNVERVML